MTNIFSELLQKSKIEKFKKNKILIGKIVSIDNNFITVDVGLKSESKISIIEFKKFPEKEFKINDEIEVVLEEIQNYDGLPTVSYEKSETQKKLNNIEIYFIKNKPIIGEVINKVKGGFEISINQIKAFLPGSLSNSNDIQIGQKLEFKIVKFDKTKTNIVVSRKFQKEITQIIPKENPIKKFSTNQIVTGIIKNITDYGAFVNLGDIDGLVHITDISWRRIKHPTEILKINDKLNLIVLKIDNQQEKIYLGIKQLTKDPWEEIYLKYPKGTKIIGKITNFTDYGIFIEIEQGIEGLLHNTYIKKKNFKKEDFKTNQMIKVSIINIDFKNKKISLNIVDEKKKKNLSIIKQNINKKLFNFFMNKNFLLEFKIKKIDILLGVLISINKNIQTIIDISRLINIYIKYNKTVFTINDKIYCKIKILNNKQIIMFKIK